MKRKLLLLGVLVLVFAVVLFGLNFWARKKEGGVCDRMIAYIQDNDATKSYALYTPDTQKLISQDKWRDNVRLLEGLYSNGKPKLVSQLASTNPATNGEDVEYHYKISNNAGSYAITCFTTGDPALIQAYDSRTELP